MQLRYDNASIDGSLTVTVTMQIEGADPRPYPYTAGRDARYLPLSLELRFRADSEGGGLPAPALLQAEGMVVSGRKLRNDGSLGTVTAYERWYGPRYGSAPEWARQAADRYLAVVRVEAADRYLAVVRGQEADQ